MKTLKWITVVLSVAMATVGAQEPAWNESAIKECDRACLVGILDGYMNAIFKRDPRAVPPLSIDVRMTENTGQIDVGEGVLWKSKTEPTTFKITVADPVDGQVAFQGRLKVQGRDTLAAIRLKVDRGRIVEIEQLHVGGIAPQAIELLTTPRSLLTDEVPVNQRVSRDVMFRVANSYFDALEGDSGKSMKHIRPRRALILDEQKQTVGTFPLFVHDGTRRGAAPDAPPGMLQNLVTMETFSVRGSLIHNVEAAPFVTLPYGLGNGWTPGSGR
jgi:hypothetical protein